MLVGSEEIQEDEGLEEEVEVPEPDFNEEMEVSVHALRGVQFPMETPVAS